MPNAKQSMGFREVSDKLYWIVTGEINVINPEVLSLSHEFSNESLVVYSADFTKMTLLRKSDKSL